MVMFEGQERVKGLSFYLINSYSYIQHINNNVISDLTVMNLPMVLYKLNFCGKNKKGWDQRGKFGFRKITLRFKEHY